MTARLQSAADAYYDARQRFYDIEAAKSEAVSEEAENIASAIVGDFSRLSNLIAIGKLNLDDVWVTDRASLEPRSVFDQLLHALADSRRPGSRFAALAPYADALVDHLAETADVREGAEYNVLRGGE